MSNVWNGTSLRLRDDPDALAGLIAQVVEVSPAPAAFLEKDFWVTEALRAVVASGARHGFAIVFKGGTSLSRAHLLTARFSEDVDLLINFPTGLSTGQREKLLNALTDDVTEHFGLGPEDVEVDHKTTGVKRRIRLHHPTRNESPAITGGVLLEVGNRGGVEPSTLMPVRSMVADWALANGFEHSSYDEFEPVEVQTLNTERTLVEKLALLATASSAFDDGDTDAFARHGRHLYDLYVLADDEATRDALIALGEDGISVLAADIHEHSVAGRFESVERGEGYTTASAFHARRSSGCCSSGRVRRLESAPIRRGSDRGRVLQCHCRASGEDLMPAYIQSS